MDEVVLDGRLYIGFFNGQPKKWIKSGQGYSGDRELHCYSGMGYIQERGSGRVFFFNFSTQSLEESQFLQYTTLEKGILAAVQQPNKLPRDKSTLIDLLLENMVSQVKQESHRAIAHITTVLQSIDVPF